ncbi:hypothetical protein GIB67_035949 [Kingdonia uniflora]|uniref:cytokinin dehydrogenase n=1 Tax=Kingdonia uniflora TaxID=39325 RepID=A0A7J7N1E3_9MAGN|nr:hypothetical protein GIB67_035949 [Kingdonia uniflora]
MEFGLSLLCMKMKFLVFLLVLSSPCKFIQSPMDFGPLSLLQTTESASLDFGRIYFNTPSGVLRPQSPKEISLLLSVLSSSSFRVTVAAKGAGHSINGQAQALNGIVVEMDYFPKSIKIHKNDKGLSFADVSGGTLWAQLLEETLKQGLAPFSWTDYLYLSIGGTLSNAGISGQTFKYGPQISNVLQLDVVTGLGELLTCSPSQDSELFYGVLGGLGQFGIITSARIMLQQTPTKVKWVRAFYDSFEDFMKDQELLVGEMADLVDYALARICITLEIVAICKPLIFQVLEEVSRRMKFMPSLLFSVEVPYFDFLNRVGMEEIHLRKIGLWDVSHPWLNMFVPRSGITKFKDLLLDIISPQSFEGPVLIYPILRDKWNSNSSVVLPESDTPEGIDNIVYIVGILRSSNPNKCSTKCLNQFLKLNRNITMTATDPLNGIGGKQYLPHYTEEEKWREHFGNKWERFKARKSSYDPLNMLAPGQAIFKRKSKYSSTSSSSVTVKSSS